MRGLREFAEQQAESQDEALWHRVDGKAQTDEAILKKLVEDHHRWTGSLRAREILDQWAERRAKFVKVFPHEYKRALGELAASRAAEATISKARVADAVKASRAGIVTVADSGPGVPWREVATIMAIATKSGIERIEFATAR